MAITDYYGTSNVVIQRATTAADGSGGTTETWADHLTIDGLLVLVSASERVLHERFQDAGTHKLYCASTHDILETDRVYYDGTYYRITGRPRDPMNRAHHYEIMLEQMR